MEARSLGNMNKQETGKKMETVKKSEHWVPGIFRKNLHFGFMVNLLNVILLTSYNGPHRSNITKVYNSLCPQIAHNLVNFPQ